MFALGTHPPVLFLLLIVTLGKLEQRDRVERLLAQADEIATHAAVDDALLCDLVQFPVDLKHADSCTRALEWRFGAKLSTTHTWRYDDALLSGPLHIPIEKVVLEGVE